MIKVPEDILTTEELVAAAGKKAEELDIEITGIALEKRSMVLNIDIKLNFVMPKNVENVMKERVRAKLGSVNRIRVNYEFTGVKNVQTVHEEAPTQASWSGDNYKRKKDEPGFTNADGELVLLGKDFRSAPISFTEAVELVGSKDKGTLEGEVFKIDQRPIKNGRVLLSLFIAAKARTFCLKAFISEDKMKEIEENLKAGELIRAQGPIEYDTYDHENVMMVQAIKKVAKEIKEDTYPNGRRVELHCHSKMSDNDGFNEVADIVNTAAHWGQPAVAITDHGVVQGFPDAANAAGKLAKAGKNIKVIYGCEGYLYSDEDAKDAEGNIDVTKHGVYHIILLVKNQTGMKNLYKLVSKAHVDYIWKGRPRMPRSLIEEYREGLIIGSACEAGELYRAVVEGKSDEELDSIASFYDYLEIQPLCNNRFMIDRGIAESMEDIKKFNLKILEIGDRLGKMTVATTDAHYPTPESSIYRDIVMAGIGFTEGTEGLYLRTTDEMMKEFEYLGDRAEEVVVTNTNKVADMIDEGILPVPKGKFPPKIEGAEDTLRTLCYDKAHEIYGDPLPEDIAERLETELSSIIGNGYAVMYIAAQMLVKKSNDDGYLVGSRGSVGSSFAATMSGITEVNPLPPHYICPKCKKYEPASTLGLNDYDTGYDMPERMCPDCGTRMKKEGLNIPFATFLGFKGDKEPDIDLNFAGEYQPIAHKYVGEIFGEKNVFKAGTVATIADKTAYGYVKHYVEDNNIPANKYDIDYLTLGCTGVKRTTGQHPGGIIVVPDDHEIYEFCPVQRPANKRDVDIITTHFDYHKIDENLLKLDILGHDGPQLIRHLQNMTGVDPMSIPLDDQRTLSIFTKLDELNIKNPDYRFTHGTYAIPEFGTNFTRNMLDDIKPTTVSALIKMSGFSHGTDVWTNNAQDLIRNKTATIDEVISCRDDIMNYLIKKGLDNSDAFHIMEFVRKNKVLSEEDLDNMRSHGVPEWYIWSCDTLKYMFPRAHAAAYVMTSLRMAWFKVNYPEAFYAAWFTSKVDDFDAEAIFKSTAELEKIMDEIDELGNTATTKQKDSLTVYEVMYEMRSRGYEFAEPVLGESEACKFKVEDGKVMLPFNAINGIGDTAADSLVEAYKEQDFFTLDDVRARTKLSQSNIEDLQKHGLFKGLPDSAQMTLFELA